MGNRRWLGLVTMVVTSSMVLSSCGADATAPAATSIQSAPIDTVIAPAATSTAPGAAPATVPTTPGFSSGSAQAGVLRINTGEAENLDPQQLSYTHEIGTAQMVYEGLLELDEQSVPVPAAAEKMDVSVDGLKYTLTIRDGLTYSDGTPLTAKNFEYSWKRLLDPRVLNKQYSFIAYDILGAEELDSTSPDDTAKVEENMAKVGITAPDDKHIEFTLKQKAAYFPYVLSLWVGWPVRKDLLEAGGQQWTLDREGKYYVGNGPFILKKKTEVGMEFVANPNYRKGKPKLNKVKFLYIKESAVAFQAYANGELEVLSPGSEDLTTVENDPVLKSHLVRIPGNYNSYVEFNTKRPPFDNMKVRQAFAQALDRGDYINNVQSGIGQVALSFIPPGRPGYAPDIQLWKFNAEAARKTLAEAGYPNGKGLPEIKLTYSSDDSRSKTRFEWTQNQLKKNLGIDAPLDPIEGKMFVALKKDPTTNPLFSRAGWQQDYPDPQDWLTLVFHSSSNLNHTGWKNEEFDRLTRAADQEPDQTKRLEMYHKAHEILIHEAPIVMIYWGEELRLIPPYVKGMKEHLSPLDWNIPGWANITNIEVAP
jgi:oligopeptide transport system substrate-binding protein